MPREVCSALSELLRGPLFCVKQQGSLCGRFGNVCVCVCVGARVSENLFSCHGATPSSHGASL